MNPLRIALCQIRPSRDCDQNIDRAFKMIAEAGKNRAGCAVLPEMFYYPYELVAIQKLGGMDCLLDRFQKAAKELGLYICTGSMAIEGPAGLTNTAFLIDPSGAVILSYSKTHLFEMADENVKVRESSVFSPGSDFPVADAAFGTVGMLICYDIRFPEAARNLAFQGAELVIVPANFNEVTGPAHWHVMLRARAIENQVFLVAVSQACNQEAGYRAYGHSLVVSPWGDVIVEADDTEAVIYADLDPRVLEETRKRLPLLKNRRKDW